MLVNERKNRLFAFSSIVCRQSGRRDQTLRARWIVPLNVLERHENQTVICAFLSAQRHNPICTMDAINES